ncbi:hypothetical protein [Pseudofrankia inefficax]|uniref:hypothetical protein n=1 Tax=Pseudofrankia inefficax (strain DSM 45817 / CECT 9037 / DDB 130130 / EuI1c) TaxID=298654 RepID=UPI0002E9EBD7|nr:hypothetical protein [Pseudofrankia inefficax]
MTPQASLWGSEPFSATWPRAGMTLAGTAYRLRPSAPLTAETASGSSPSWPIPTASAGERGGRGDLHAQATTGKTSRRRDWPTPTASDATSGPGHAATSQGSPNLRTAVTHWPTPTASLGDARRGMPSPDVARRRLESGRRNLDDAVMWPTPTARDSTRGAGWDGPGRPLSETAGGRLNPEWVELMMGLPPGWTQVD